MKIFWHIYPLEKGILLVLIEQGMFIDDMWVRMRYAENGQST